MLVSLDSVYAVIFKAQTTSSDTHKILFSFMERYSWQRGSMVRVGDLNAEDPGSNHRLGLLNEFILSDPRGKFTTLYK